jgi:CBS domain-containing protein
MDVPRRSLNEGRRTLRRRCRRVVLADRHLDVICFVALEGAEALRLPVSVAMSDPWLIATPEQPVADVMQAMTKERVRHMPVMSDGNLIGYHQHW